MRWEVRRVARTVFRMLVAGSYGAALGLLFWSRRSQPWWLGGSGGEGWPFAPTVLGAAAFAALVVWVLDMLELDPPLLPARWSRSEARPELAFSAYLAELQSAARRGAALPPPPPQPAPEPSIRAAIRDWSSGSITPEIKPRRVEKLERWLGVLERSQFNLGLLVAATFFMLIGIGVEMIYGVTAGVLGHPGDGRMFFWIGIALCVAVFAIGGTAWRMIAPIYALVIALAMDIFSR